MKPAAGAGAPEATADAAVALPGPAGRFPATRDEELWVSGPFAAESVFGRLAPLEVEIGSGKARFLIEMADRNPAHDFVGIELSLAYYRVCRRRVARSGLANAAVLRADGRRFVESALQPLSVRAFHVYFPDPWPKKKQRKRRLFDAASLELFASRLEPSGTLRIATDHGDYGASLASLLPAIAGLERLDWNELPEPPATHYELKYRAEGRPISRFLLRKTDSGSGRA